MSEPIGHQISRAVGYAFLGVYASAIAGAALYGLWKLTELTWRDLRSWLRTGRRDPEVTIERGRIKHKMRRALDRELAWPGQLGEEYETRVKNKIIEKYGEQYWKDINKSKKQRQWEKKARLDGLLVKEEVELDYVNEMQEEFNRMTMQNMRRDVRGTMVELTNINEPKIRVKI